MGRRGAVGGWRTGVTKLNKLAVIEMVEAAEWHGTWAILSLISSSSSATQLSSFLVDLQGLSLLSCAAHLFHCTQIRDVLFMQSVCTWACVHAHEHAE